MHLRLTDDEVVVDDLFGTFFATESSTARVRAAEPLGFDPDMWAKLTQTGAPGMGLPESVGGAGADLATMAVVVNQLGRHLAPVPFIEHVAATRLLVSLDGSHRGLPDLVAGRKIATLALNGPHLVPAGAVADVVLAEVGEVVVLESSPPGAGPRNTPDLPLADRDLNSASRIGDRGWDTAVAEWQALMATALVGMGQRAIEIGVDYVKTRRQFGVAVGTFQAIQHGLASAVTAMDGAAHLASRAVWALDTDAEDAHRLAAMAFLFAAESAQHATATSLQYHGGYGYAEEYDIQLYYRRARGWALQYGDPHLEYQRLADLVLPRAV